MCFNPHTHAGCDFGVIQARQEAVVSIHTPTQGVTIVIFNGINISIVSIHTPTQGVTSHLSSVSSMECFNPHTHAGCDLKRPKIKRKLDVFQSTHPRRV